MVKLNKLMTGLFIAAMCVALPAGVVRAGSVTATGDKESAAVGDTYTVGVKIDGAEGAAKAPEVSVNYNTNRLEFVSCSGEYGGGGGGFITLNSTESDITFNILSGGQADVEVSATFEDSPETQTATVTVMVDGEDTAAAAETTAEDAGTGVEAGTIATADGKLVSSVFADEFMPVGFYKTTVTYEEQMVEAAQFDMGRIVLLYVTDADGNNGNFDIYDQTTGQLSDFLQISGIENRFIIALSAGSEVTVPTDFTKATLQWNNETLEAYTYTGTAPENGSVNISDFFLIYAVSSEGNMGWYLYDQNEGTYQRYVEGLHGGAAVTSDSLITQITNSGSDSEEGGVNVMLIIVIACAVLLVALIVTVIIMAVKLHEFNSYEYIDEDEDVESVDEDSISGSESENENRADAVRKNALNENSAQERGEHIDDREEQYFNAPKNDNIYEKFRREEELRAAERRADMSGTNRGESDRGEAGAGSINMGEASVSRADMSESSVGGAAANNNIPEEFIVRRKAGRIPEEELDRQNRYERDYEEGEDDTNMFSPRGRGRYDDDDDNDEDYDDRKLTRAEKKALKAEEKARKKAEKRMRKEYGEYGPVDWESWQNGVEGGEKTAAAHMNRAADVDEGAVRRAERSMQEERPMRDEIQGYAEEPMREERPSRQEMPRRAPEAEYYEGTVRRAERPMQPAKDNPMDMMRGIPANDNKAPVQAKPVQQFDFDDDFEFEFLDLEDDE